MVLASPKNKNNLPCFLCCYLWPQPGSLYPYISSEWMNGQCPLTFIATCFLPSWVLAVTTPTIAFLFSPLRLFSPQQPGAHQTSLCFGKSLLWFVTSVICVIVCFLIMIIILCLPLLLHLVLQWLLSHFMFPNCRHLQISVQVLWSSLFILGSSSFLFFK